MKIKRLVYAEGIRKSINYVSVETFNSAERAIDEDTDIKKSHLELREEVIKLNDSELKKIIND